jgi:hypothetical protein
MMRKLSLFAFLILVCMAVLVPTQALAGRAAQAETTTPEATEAVGESPTPEQVTPTTPVPVGEEPTLTPAPEETAPAVETTSPPAAFSITGVEPGRINAEAGGPLSIYGTGFLPGTAVRLVGFGLLDSAVLNSTAIRVVVPPGLKKGSCSLSVILPDGQQITIENAFRVVPEKNPTPTATASGRSSVFAQPQIVIQAAHTEPEILKPGDPFTLSFQVANLGGYTAGNLRVSLGASSLAVPRDGSSLWVIDRLLAEGTAELSLHLALTSTAPAGYGSLELVIEYYDYLGQQYTSTQSVGLRISSNLTAQPRVLLSAYHTDPEVLSPGDTFQLAIDLINAGKSDTDQILVTLGGEDGSGIKPFAILGASNVRFLSQLASGETVQVEHRLIVDGAAESGVYNLPVSLAYDDLNGERRVESHLINLLVNRRPQIQIDFYNQPAPGLVGQPLILPIELVNIGRSPVNISTAEISGEELEVQTGSAYIGVLDGGTAGTLDAEITPQAGGSLPVLVSVHYLDDFNQPQVLTQTLTVQVEEPAAPETPEENATETEAESLGDWILKIVRGLFGLGS